MARRSRALFEREFDADAIYRAYADHVVHLAGSRPAWPIAAAR
jgi:hypothetical protein